MAETTVSLEDRLIKLERKYARQERYRENSKYDVIRRGYIENELGSNPILRMMRENTFRKYFEKKMKNMERAFKRPTIRSVNKFLEEYNTIDRYLCQITGQDKKLDPHLELPKHEIYLENAAYGMMMSMVTMIGMRYSETPLSAMAMAIIGFCFLGYSKKRYDTGIEMREQYLSAMRPQRKMLDYMKEHARKAENFAVELFPEGYMKI